MKTSSKLTLVNVLATLFLASVVLFVVFLYGNKYMKNNFYSELVYEHVLLEYKVSDISIIPIGKPRGMGRSTIMMAKNKHSIMTSSIDKPLDVIQIVIDIDTGSIVSSYNYNPFPVEDILNTFGKKLNTLSTVFLDDVTYISFSSTVDNYLLISLLPDTFISSFITPIFLNLVLLIVIITLASIGTSFYAQKIITAPINILIKATKEIGEKNFNFRAIVNTNDEFGSLANSLNKMSISLQKKDLEQKQLYENLSHEIKTPITVISGYAQGVQSGIMDISKLNIIVDECDKLKKQVENIIYLSKLDTVEDFYNFEKTNINLLIGNVLNGFNSLIILNNIDIIFEPSTDVFTNVDKDKFTRAITNIVSNSIKHTKTSIYVDVLENKKNIIINIFDDGDGFSKTLLDNPFKGITFEEKGGTGVGLTLIKKIIDGHNGTISLSNKKNYGALYKITLSK